MTKAKQNEIAAGLAEHARTGGDCYGCPYQNEPFCHHKLCKDALELLKAQEPRLVINIHKAYNNVLNPDVPWVGKCPKCGKRVSGKNLTRFCMYCGQAVKWE